MCVCVGGGMRGLCFFSLSRLLQVSQSFAKFFSCVSPEVLANTHRSRHTHRNHSLGTHCGARLDSSFARFIFIFSAPNRKTQLRRLDDLRGSCLFQDIRMEGSHRLRFVLWFDRANLSWSCVCCSVLFAYAIGFL